MTNSDIAYLLFLSFVLAASYFPIRLLQHYFFQSTKPFAIKNNWIISFLITVLFSLGIYAISFSIANEELSNRVIHAFGGGFLAYMVSFLAAKDASLIIKKPKFFIFTFMLVMTLGIFNEVAEFILQNYFDFTAAPHINDTWLDLISNIVGALLAGLCFTPFLKSPRVTK